MVTAHLYRDFNKNENLSIFSNSDTAFRMSPGNYILKKFRFGIFRQDVGLKYKSLVLKYIQRSH